MSAKCFTEAGTWSSLICVLANAAYQIDSTLLPSCIVISPESRNAYWPIFLTLSGTVMWCSIPSFSKHPSRIANIDSLSFTSDKNTQLSKALLPIFVTESGISTFEIIAPQNAMCPIPFVPSFIFTVPLFRGGQASSVSPVLSYRIPSYVLKLLFFSVNTMLSMLLWIT